MDTDAGEMLLMIAALGLGMFIIMGMAAAWIEFSRIPRTYGKNGKYEADYLMQLGKALAENTSEDDIRELMDEWVKDGYIKEYKIENGTLTYWPMKGGVESLSLDNNNEYVKDSDLKRDPGP